MEAKLVCFKYGKVNEMSCISNKYVDCSWKIQKVAIISNIFETDETSENLQDFRNM